MKLIAGHKYLKNASGSEIVPYTEQMAKTLGVGTNPLCTWVVFIAAETTSNEMQLPENEKVVARKALPVQIVEPEPEPEPEPEIVQVAKVALPTRAAPIAAPVAKPIVKKPVPVVAKKMQHMDIRADMAADLAALD